MSRLFNGTSDQMTFGPTEWLFGTLLVVGRIMVAADDTWLSFAEGFNSTGDLKYGIGRRGGTGNLNFSDGVSPKDAIAINDSDNWTLWAVTKATGTVAAVLHKIPIGGSPTHTTHGSTSINSGTTAGGSMKVGGDATTDFANIKVAVVALLPGTVLSNAEIEGVATAKTTQSLADLMTSSHSLYDDSDAFATNLINPGVRDRTAISGTTDDADDPSGWVYGLGGAPGASQRFMWMP